MFYACCGAVPEEQKADTGERGRDGEAGLERTGRKESCEVQWEQEESRIKERELGDPSVQEILKAQSVGAKGI